MLTQLTRYASVQDVTIESAEMELRATFPLEGKYGGDPDVGVAMERLTYTIDIKSDAPRERVARLIETSERYCHAANSLRIPVPVDGTLRVNGEAVAFSPPQPPELRR